VDDLFERLVRRWLANAISDQPRLEVVSALVLAPLVEEAIFRLAVFRAATARPAWRGALTLGSAVAFGLMHVRFGRWFVGYAFSGGLILWATYARAGYWGAVLLHAIANVVDLSVGWRRYLYQPAE
jgi:membrane protease YdiL (CAAX protease family)